MNQKITLKEIEDFINLSYLEVNFFDNTFINIGLKYGESKKLKPFFSRNKQIKILNHIKNNFPLYRDLILNESNNIIRKGGLK